MQPGNVFTIEPIFMMKPAKVPYMWADEWTMTSPGNPSGKSRSNFSKLLAQWEHTVLITEKGCEVLTKRPDEDLP
jgi:Methionine aminopeptidase